MTGLPDRLISFGWGIAVLCPYSLRGRSMNKDEMLAAANEARLTHIAPDLARLTLESIRLKTRKADESAIPIGATKVGGLPDLPAGIAWPAWKGAPQSFAAQINLAEVRPLDHSKSLPSTGHLYFFYDSAQNVYGSDPSDKGGWQTIFFDGKAAQLSRVSAPPNLPSGARYQSCAVEASVEATLPHEPEVLLPRLRWSDAEKLAYSNFLASYPSTSDRALPHHRLLGQPDQIQDDMHLAVQLVSHGVNINDESPPADVVKGALNWRLLFQIDTDPRAGMNWANNGMVYYWIESDALKARQFDRVWAMLQSE